MKLRLLTFFISALLCFSESRSLAQIETPPPFSNPRAMAEWEEVQALTIAWTGFPSILKQIVAAARLETEVIILTDDAAATEDYLMSANDGGPAFASMDNVTLLPADYDSIWMRDYGANPVYGNEVDSLILVDWMYNRPRPNDDASPLVIADHLGLDLYSTSQAPNELRYTGGNYMSDGFGTAFASKLILQENDGDGDFSIFYPTHTEEEIDNILHAFMGIDTYIKMETLPYDGIHHIDMHMKIIDEETLLVGQYPDGVADGPQIEANLEYVLSNYNSKFGTPFRVIRIPMPNSTSGLWPDSSPTPGYYRTYTNAVFVNKTLIFPTYREEYDTTAYRIWGEALPGYTIVGIDSDNSDANIISQSGAIHCITHTVGVEDPLLISHQPLDDTNDYINPYGVSAYMNHRDGISNATLYWKTSMETDFTFLAMSNIGSNNWYAYIPPQPVGTIIQYYLQGQATTGKVQVRPMPAPEGFWTFEVIGPDGVEEAEQAVFGNVYPNPANAITCIEMDFKTAQSGSLYLLDVAGRNVMQIYNGFFRSGDSKYFFDASSLEAGVYRVVVKTERGYNSYPVMVK